jgi:hypothetical protein
VIRHQRPGNVVATPVSTTSVDGGGTWAPLSTLEVSFPNRYDPLDDASGALLGIAPQLRLMPNGVVVLSSGRPDNWIAMSTNGQGTGWIGQLTYRNCPTNGYRFHGSTGNTGVTTVGSSRLLQVGDNCESTWSCVLPDETDFTVDKQNRIWRRFVHLLTPDVGKSKRSSAEGLLTLTEISPIETYLDVRSSAPGRLPEQTPSLWVRPCWTGAVSSRTDRPIRLPPESASVIGQSSQGHLTVA